jgi:hypothetical protein
MKLSGPILFLTIFTLSSFDVIVKCRQTDSLFNKKSNEFDDELIDQK